jgi:uncharacterized protein
MEITEKQKLKIDELSERYQLKLVLLFGSRATGKINKESDFDVAYLPEKNLSYEQETDINLQFTFIFSHDRVDTVDLRKAPPLLLFGIFKNCQVLFAEDDLIFYRYRAYAIKKYIDAEQFYEEKFDKLKNTIKNL